MKTSGRKLMMVANWKMNKTAIEAEAFVEDLALAVGHQLEVNVLVCPAFTALERVGNKLEGTHLLLGAQNMHAERSGAYTGEVSAEMLRQLFVTHVILGHSERRQLFGETDDFVNQKVKTALENKLRPILCIGESAEAHAQGLAHAVIAQQLVAGLADVSEKSADAVTIAYEPLWAIGTGNVATPELAQAAHVVIRSQLAELWGASAAQRVRIIYGGSMKPDNVEALLRQPDVDGGLIGGASLEARTFIKMIETAQQVVVEG